MSQSRDPKSDSDEGLEFTAHSSGQVLMALVNRPTERKRDLMTAKVLCDADEKVGPSIW